MSTIETERLLLRYFTDNDAEAMFRNWTSDERVSEYCRWHFHKSIDQTRKLLNEWLSEYERGIRLRWGITLKEGNGDVVGMIGVVGIFNHGKKAAVGYVLSHEQWGKGMMTEALEAVIQYLFEHGFREVVACHHVDNPASGRVMEKCGMRFSHYNYQQDKLDPDTVFKVRCYSIKRKKLKSFFGKLLKNIPSFCIN